MNYKSAAQLKAIAKEQSLGKYGTLIGANLVIFAISLLVTGFASVSASEGILIIIINTLISLIINILLGILASGKAYLYMNLLYSQTVSTSDIFFGFKQQPQKAVIIQSVFVLADFITTIPAQIFMYRYITTKSQTDMTALTLTVCVGLLINLIVYLIYSQSFFILHDFPDKPAKEILATSRRLMRGNKFRLFYLNASYIPLYLLGVISLLVPILWVEVYRYASTCAFYQDLIATAAGKDNN